MSLSQFFAYLRDDTRTNFDDNDPLDAYWLTLFDSYHETFPPQIAIYGNNASYALSMRRLELELEDTIERLFINRKNTEATYNIYLSPIRVLLAVDLEDIDFGFQVPQFLAYNESLHSRWMMLFYAMAGSNYWRSLHVENIGLPKSLLDGLASVLSKRRSYRSSGYFIHLCNCNLSQAEIGSVSSIIQQNNGLLKTLTLERDAFNSMETANQLSLAIQNRGEALTGIQIKNCSLGNNTRVLSTMINACANLQELCLGCNGIRSRGAAEVSDFIASNPILMKLDLSNNDLSDTDASLIANSLQSNTYLQELTLCGNKITRTGVNTLANVVFDTTTLNSLYDGNNTCKILIDDQHDDRFECVSFMRKLYKVLVGYTGDGCLMNLHYLNDVPLEFMPDVMSLIMKANKMFGRYKQSQSLMFEIMRKWHLPLLYYYRSSQNCHPQDVVLCIDELVSKVSGDGIRGIDFHNSLLPIKNKSEYNVVIPKENAPDGLLIDIVCCAEDKTAFFGYRSRKDGSMGASEFFNLMQPGDLITGINGCSTTGKSVQEVKAMFNDSLVFVYLRLERGIQFHNSFLPIKKEGEYDVIMPAHNGLFIKIGGLSGGSVIFMGHSLHPRLHRKHESKGFHLPRIGDIITAVDGRSTTGKSFQEVIAMLKESQRQGCLTYLRLEKRNSYIRQHGLQSLVYFGSVPEVGECTMDLTAYGEWIWPSNSFEV